MSNQNALQAFLATVGSKSTAEMEKRFFLPPGLYVLKTNEIAVAQNPDGTPKAKYSSFEIVIRCSIARIIEEATDMSAITAAGGIEKFIEASRGKIEIRKPWMDRQDGTPKPDYTGPSWFADIFGVAMGLYNPADEDEAPNVGDVLMHAMRTLPQFAAKAIIEEKGDKKYLKWQDFTAADAY